MRDEELAIAQVEEMQAVSAVLKGKYTMTGEAFDPVEVDMGRSAANNITQSGGTEWSKRDKSTYDPTDDIEAYALNASGVVNIIVFDPKGWALFRSFKAVREKLDTRRGSHSELETAVKDLGEAVSYKGMYGDTAIVVYSGQYVENDVKKNFLPDNTMVLGNTQARGLRTYGCIQDADAQREGINASARYPKNWVTTGDPASVSFRIAAPAAPSRIELTPGYFQITATPHLAVYDPTVQFEFWFSEKRIADIRQVETTARYLGTALYWIAASINIKPGHDYYFYIRSVNTVGKSAFVEAVGQASDDASGYLDFFKGQITESHLGKELLEKVELTEDNASKLEEFSKEWKDASDKWNAMWGVKIEQTEDGRHYVTGLGLSMEDTEEGKLSQFLVAANRIAFIDPANGNETPMFVAQGNQIFMNDVFLKRLTAPTITSGGSPPVFSLTSDGKLTAKNADISGSVNANSGTLNNVTINENCQIKGKLSANQIEGDIVKTVSKSFPRTSTYASGTITVRISDDQKFDRQVMIPPVLFRGGKHENFNSNNQQSYWYSTCRLRVTRNGQE
ncbi:phage tail tip protein, partial [Escherichia coli]